MAMYLDQLEEIDNARIFILATATIASAGKGLSTCGIGTISAIAGETCIQRVNTIGGYENIHFYNLLYFIYIQY